MVAVWLHYFLLVWFAWMLIEGIYLYLMVITVFDNNNEQLRLYGVCAYGKIADQYVSVLKLIAQYVYLWYSSLNWQNIRNILLIFWYRYTWSYCSYFCKFCARRLWHRFEVRTSSAVRIWNPDKTWNLSTSFSIYSSMFFFCIILAAGCPWQMESFMHSSFLHCW